MNKQEFVDRLRMALNGRVSPGLVMDKVFVTEKLGQYLKRKHARVSIEHRDLHRNPVEHDANDIMEGKV